MSYTWYTHITWLVILTMSYVTWHTHITWLIILTHNVMTWYTHHTTHHSLVITSPLQRLHHWTYKHTSTKVVDVLNYCNSATTNAESTNDESTNKASLLFWCLILWSTSFAFENSSFIFRTNTEGCCECPTMMIESLFECEWSVRAWHKQTCGGSCVLTTNTTMTTWRWQKGVTSRNDRSCLGSLEYVSCTWISQKLTVSRVASVDLYAYLSRAAIQPEQSRMLTC